MHAKLRETRHQKPDKNWPIRGNVTKERHDAGNNEPTLPVRAAAAAAAGAGVGAGAASGWRPAEGGSGRSGRSDSRYAETEPTAEERQFADSVQRAQFV